MIKIGLCTSIDNIDKAYQAGFEYIELSLSSVAAMTDEEFEDTLRKNAAAKIHVESCNGMVPGSVRLTGPEVNAQTIHNYLDKAFSRAEQLGVKVVVFGSSAARNKPDGFDTAQAWRQIANFLRLAEKHAAEHDIMIAIEPLRRQEANLINYVSEATILASLVQMPHIGVLGDTYHMAVGGESYESLAMAGDLLKHVHVACALKRACPAPGDGEPYKELFDVLKSISYEGRVSIEAGFEDFDKNIGPGYKVLSEARG